VKGIGPGKIRALLQRYPDTDCISQLNASDMMQVGGITRGLANSIKMMDESIGKKAIADANKVNARYITYWDNEFPDRLKRVFGSPIGIYIIGKLKNIPKIGVVGSRKPTSYGKLTCNNLTEELIKSNLGIVSGLARGIDSIAHGAAVKNGGYTIAVMGSGINICYPPENRSLMEKIIETSAIISEFPPGTPPDSTNFPKRNRIISGLSKGILVVEAGKKSGAVITAYLALDQNREVFAVPGRIDSKQSYGCHKLIQQGAKLVTSVDDILEEFQLPKAPFQTELIPDLTDAESELFRFISNEAIQIDHLCNLSGKDTPEVLTNLLQLELKGCIIQLPGKNFTRR
jgi:DNA processing protein